jgi:hypothetical protein
MSNFTSDPMPARHVFKFAVSGIELNADQQRHVAEHVARAGAQALATLDLAPHDELMINLPEWLGKWLLLMEEGALEREQMRLNPEVIGAQRKSLARLGQ